MHLLCIIMIIHALQVHGIPLSHIILRTGYKPCKIKLCGSFWIFMIGPWVHIGQAKRNKIGMLSVHDRVIQLKLNLFFKIFNHEKAPCHFLTFPQRRTTLYIFVNIASA